MPTPVTHAFASVATVGILVRRPSRRLWVCAVFCGTLADIDTLGLRLRLVPYDSLLGHRGLAHSLPFALAVSLSVVYVVSHKWGRFSRRWWAVTGLLFVAGAFHTVLDMMTDGGLGVALLSPFGQGRYFLPWRPIEVSPIGLRRFLSLRGLEVMLSELLWVWAPLTLAWLAARAWRLRGDGPSQELSPDRSAGK